MAEAGVAADGNLVTASGPQALRQRFAALSMGRRLAMLAGVAAVIALIVGFALWSREPAYRVLFTNIPDAEGGAIIQALQQANVPYRLEGGGTISVPADQVYDLRLRLAAQGLPKSGNVGFELMDNQKFGISQFAEQVNYQRAIEGELARSIQTVAAVDQARVHLAIPKQTVFLRDQQKPTASVMLTLRPGRVLDDAQVAGIVHLVSSSVPALPVRNVTVVDQDGNLLSRSPEQHASNLDARQLLYVQQIEKNYVERVQAILEPIVGKGNARAEVTAQIDFAEVEQTSETFKPNNASEAAIRSRQTLSQTGQSAEQGPAGVPGALSNQPPGAAVAPLTAPVASGVGPGTSGSSSARNESTTNYEVDKTIQHVKQPVGSIKRLSAAVVVNYKPGTDRSGKATYVPYTPQEVAQLNNLVREAIGFNERRGDSVNLVNAAFAESMPLEARPLQDQALDYLRQNYAELIKLLLIGVVVLYLLFFVVRPLMKDLARPREQPGTYTVDLGETETEEESAAIAGEEEDAARSAAFADLMQQSKELAKNDPRMVATILREWMSNEEENVNPNKVG
ncbi:flagellar basal-body MS-ring/collar protein FliF [Chitiniphilus purpureus]|uniref:Flagellar M-ring protein n=1 Tax=Chitiniphilus purpureus TaxID=2981137 RepID=A0ABY6DJT2_9NEIS|nr:flagellar basal-body MS-ring/collar protein FliF [Chitiniphilus sp. CD1]UXY14592.1 flagellar basal-body MS-ring/collar protein FliF [Chitiniphilus sp. CD1]